MSHTNYNGISTKNTADENVVNNTNENETVITPDEIEEPELILGVVTVAKLNVRKHPSIFADVLLVIGADSDVLVDPDESTDEWYKVYIDEKEGFCMKKFIELDQ